MPRLAHGHAISLGRCRTIYCCLRAVVPLRVCHSCIIRKSGAAGAYLLNPGCRPLPAAVYFASW
jgi:hypothetical protein